MFNPESLRIIPLLAFFILFLLGFKRSVFFTASYMILVYCKLSSYYSMLGTIKAELLFALIILLILFLKKNSSPKLSANYNPINMYIFLLIISSLVSFSVAWNRQYSWDNAIYHFIKVLLLYCMVLLSISDVEELKIFIWSFVLMLVYLAYEPFYGFFHGIGGTQVYYGVNYTADKGVLAGHVALANNMNQMIPIALYLFLSVKKKSMKLISLIPLIIFIAALIGSGSRGGLVGFFGFIICLVVFSKNRIKFGVLGVLVMLVMFAFSPEIKHTISRINPEGASGRITGLTHGIGMLQRGNILGVGPGCFLFARGRYFGYTMESHNLYGEIIGELGVPGIIVWFLLFRQTFLNLREIKKKININSPNRQFLILLTTGLQISLIVRMFVSMASHGIYYFYWYVMFALSIVVLKIVDEENKCDFPGNSLID